MFNMGLFDRFQKLIGDGFFYYSKVNYIKIDTLFDTL
jgi:hypothetical protein